MKRFLAFILSVLMLVRRQPLRILLCVTCPGIIIVGCRPVTQKAQVEESPFGEQTNDYIVVFVLDDSGSFVKELNPKTGKAYPYLMGAVESFFRNRLGNNDRVILAQISGLPDPAGNGGSAVIWDGSPKALREEFPDGESFMKFVLEHSSPHGSRVHDSTADALEYLLGFPSVQQKKCKSVVFVLSDFDDNFPDKEKSKKRLIECINRYAKLGGSLGIYWCDLDKVNGWRSILQQSGMKHWTVISRKDKTPPSPVFE